MRVSSYYCDSINCNIQEGVNTYILPALDLLFVMEHKTLATRIKRKSEKEILAQYYRKYIHGTSEDTKNVFTNISCNYRNKEVITILAVRSISLSCHDSQFVYSNSFIFYCFRSLSKTISLLTELCQSKTFHSV